MSMSRKDYVALAHALNDAMPRLELAEQTESWQIAYAQWERDRRAVADVCWQMSGPNGFDQDRFLRACATRSK